MQDDSSRDGEGKQQTQAAARQQSQGAPAGRFEALGIPAVVSASRYTRHADRTKRDRDDAAALPAFLRRAQFES